MMIQTLITEENADRFLPAVGDWALMHGDVLLGAVEEETDTACGVLAAEAISDHVLAVRWLYVDEGMRRRGAGRALIQGLKELADEIGADAVVCSFVRSGEQDAVSALLRSCDLVEEDEQPVPVYSYRISDMQGAPEETGTVRILPFQSLSEKDWAKLEEAWQDEAAYEERLSGFLLDRAFCDQGNSFVAYDKEGMPIGILAVSAEEQGFWIEEFYVRGRRMEKTGEALLCALIRQAGRTGEGRILASYEHKGALFLLDLWTGGKGEKMEEMVRMTYYPDTEDVAGGKE